MMKLLRPCQANPTPKWQQRREAAGALVASFAGGSGIDHLQAHPASIALGGADGALRYLHQEWVTLFGVALEEELERVPAIRDAAWLAWDRVAMDEPRLVEILWASRASECLAEADHRHRARLAALAGCPAHTVPGFVDRSVPQVP